MKQSTVAGTPHCVLHIIVPKRGRLRSCVIKQSGFRFQQNGGPLMSRFIKPGDRNQALDETHITFITVQGHSLGMGTRLFFVDRTNSTKYCNYCFVCVFTDCAPHCYRVVGPATHFLFVLYRMFTYRISRFIRRIFSWRMSPNIAVRLYSGW
jgi:hypothetical protein